MTDVMKSLRILEFLRISIRNGLQNSFRVRSVKTRNSNAAFSIPVFSRDAADSGIQCFQFSNTKRKTKNPQKMQPNFIPKKVK